MLNMDIDYENDVLFVRLSGTLNHNTAYKINDYLLKILLKNEVKCLVINIHKLVSIDEWGIDAFLNCKTAIKENDGLIYICEIPKNLKRQVKYAKIKKCKDEEKAFRLLEAY